MKPLDDGPADPVDFRRAGVGNPVDWALADKEYLRAVAMVTGLNREITVDLIRMENASPSIQSQVACGAEI